jgi:hypothetical protein
MVRMEDLMVGNFAFGVLNGERKCFSVTDIMTREPSPTRMIFSEDEEISPLGVLVSEGAIEGIPVTVDILKRIGFKEDTALVKFYRYWDKDDKYKLDVDEGYTNSGKNWSVHIDNGDCATIGSGEFDYVHELQNLTRIITGHSLPITKEMLQ